MTVTVNPAAAGNTNVTGNITFARVPFATAAQDPTVASGMRAPIQQPARGVIVRALNAGTHAVLATGSTDNLGNYSLSVAANTTITIQVVARMLRDASQALPRWDVRVQDGTTGNNPYTTPIRRVSIPAPAPRTTCAIPTGISAAGAATGTRASAPFAILDTMYQGIQTVLGVAPTTNFPALIVDWGSQADGTFFSSGNPQYIALLSDLARIPTSSTSTSSHTSSATTSKTTSRAPTTSAAHTAWATSSIRASLSAKDSVTPSPPSCSTIRWRATAPMTTGICGPAFSTSRPIRQPRPWRGNDNYGCWCSESSVWSMLWDLYDNAADANDGIALGFRRSGMY